MSDQNADASTVEHTTGSFQGVRNTKIFYQEWAPLDHHPARGVIIIIHGYAEHGGRYDALARDLVADGFAVCALDHRGHGHSDGKRVQVEKFDDFVDDLNAYRESVRERYPAPLPLFLVGHSMGGLITLRYLTRDMPEVDGVVVSGAAVAKPTDVSGLTIAIGRVLALVAPDFGVVDLPLDKISRDPAVVEAYNNDPLVFNQKIRARLGGQMLDTMDVTDKALPTLTLPILVMHGSDDVLSPADGGRMIEATVGSSDKTLKIYDGLWHEIYNEPERDVVIADLITWLNAHT
ncbi:MAG: lysophospholipase [Actinomycetes bacterium]